MEIGAGLPALDQVVAWGQQQTSAAAKSKAGGGGQELAGIAGASEVKPFAMTLRAAVASSGPSQLGADLAQAISGTRETQVRAEQAADRFARGEPARLHETMLDLEKAEISLKVLVGVRNKILEAYREVMHLGG